eukprot:gnl/TRDRNA2_/TRDRNA2_177502_c7_seq4.p1 gnl/TRDRNA2_/TRDRNA2_177502_c7~~gnl/TRDRNA2_/TRDRNA2_177502_c7_seq4.p1  ORF type:complete len:612 (+),score=248.13 gnl/TRDRNA2_/TRDRNA2_177502_c7_seq4:83-1837(+)
MDTFTTKIEELADAAATATADLKAATEIRAKEAAEFAAEEKEMVKTVDELTGALAVMEKGGASMVQLKSARTVEQALSTLVQASAFSAQDAKQLAALVQSSSDSSDDDEELAAPAGANYENHSGGIVDLLTSLHEKAESKLSDARAAETKAINDFEMLKLSLEDEVKYANLDMNTAKKDLAEATETKGTAEGDLEVSSKDLAEDKKASSELHHECMSKANAFETETAERAAELKALATAKKIIVEATEGALAQTYSFLQVALPESRGFAAVHFVRRLAKQEHSKSLAQLAMHMASAVRYSTAAGANPFDKIKGLIMDMIEKLETEAEEDAAKKGYCDKEMSETSAKKEDKEAEIEKLSTKTDQMSTKAAQLKEEVAVIQKELAALAQTQATMDDVRHKEKAEFDTAKAELDQGIAGIKLALKTLRDYYAKGDATSGGDAGAGIISMLEVAESDCTKNLQDITSAEEMSASEYEESTKENALEKTTKTQDAKYKTKEAKGLDESVAETSSDKTSVQTELDAVLEYFEKIKAKCVAKVEPYEEKKKRREAEIAGLKEGLEILESESSLIQKSSKHTTLRGMRKHHA